MAGASAPLSDETIATIGETLVQCSGGGYDLETRQVRGPEFYRPLLPLLHSRSTDLDEKTGSDLYHVARAMLPPIGELPDFILDPSTQLKCPARPHEAVALLQYLAGDEAGDLRGPNNTFFWLGLAAERGIGTRRDAEQARMSYLKGRLRRGGVSSEYWSDGIDTDLLANIQRAGLRAYLEELAQSGGGAARMTLAEEILPTDPSAARKLLRTAYPPALNRLLELEAKGSIPIAHDDEDIAFWLSVAGPPKFRAHGVKGAELANGGTIPTSPERPKAKDFSRFVDADALGDVNSWSAPPLPIRALVNPEGRALYIEDCGAEPLEPCVRMSNLSYRLDAISLYRPERLPALPVTLIDGRPSYGWIILPAVWFSRVGQDKVGIRLTDLPADQCAFSNLLDADAALP
ncbi:MAG: hypothetical protein ACKO1N_00030 [Erythrobacter sp.]